MSKLEQHQLWETYSVDLLLAIRWELLTGHRFEAVKIVDKIIEKKLPTDSDLNIMLLIFIKIKKRDI